LVTGDCVSPNGSAGTSSVGTVPGTDGTGSGISIGSGDSGAGGTTGSGTVTGVDTGVEIGSTTG